MKKVFSFVPLVPLFFTILIISGCAQKSIETSPVVMIEPITRYEAKQLPQKIYTEKKANSKTLEEQPIVSGLEANGNLPDAFNAIQIDTKVQIVVADNVQGTVVNPPENVPLEAALTMLCFPGGYSWKRIELPDGKYYYLVGSAMPGDPSAIPLIITEKIRTNRPADQVYDLLTNLSYKPYVSIIAPQNTAESISRERKTVGMLGTAQYIPLINEPEDSTHELVITGPPEIVEKIKKTVQEVIDSPLKQVAIQLVCIENWSKVSKKIGMKWPGFDINATGTIEISRGLKMGFGSSIMGELLSNIQAMVQKGQLELKEFPQTVTTEGTLAVINTQTQEYLSIKEPRILGNNNYYYRPQVESYTYGTVLMVRPLIAENGDIILRMATQVDDISGTNSDGLPIISKRSSQNEIRVASGETVVIGGVYRQLSKSDKEGIPILGQIPIVDIPMSMKTKDQHTKDLVFFLTARVLEPISPDDIKSDLNAEVMRETFRTVAPVDLSDRILEPIKPENIQHDLNSGVMRETFRTVAPVDPSELKRLLERSENKDEKGEGK